MDFEVQLILAECNALIMLHLYSSSQIASVESARQAARASTCAFPPPTSALHFNFNPIPDILFMTTRHFTLRVSVSDYERASPHQAC